MAEGTDRYTATRLSAELGLDNRKMRDVLTRVNPVQVKGRSKLYLLRDVIPHAAKYLGAPDLHHLKRLCSRSKWWYRRSGDVTFKNLKGFSL